MSLDTLFADLDEGLIVLTFRGVDRVRSDDLSDVKTVLIASEQIADRPLSEQHYRALLDAFEDDPVGLKEAMPASLLEAAAQQGAPAGEGDPFAALLVSKFGP